MKITIRYRLARQKLISSVGNQYNLKRALIFGSLLTKTFSKNGKMTIV